MTNESMGIVVMKVENHRYVRYDYWDGKKPVSVYCGKEGDPKTEEKIVEAKQRHYESKLERSRRKLLE